MKAIKYNVEEPEEIAGLGLIFTKEIIKDIDEICSEAQIKKINRSDYNGRYR